MSIANRLVLAQAYCSSTRDFPFRTSEGARGILKAPCTRIGPRFVPSVGQDWESAVARREIIHLCK